MLKDPAVRALACKSEEGRAAIVQEVLRWQPPTALLPRMCSADTELGGVQISAGDWVLFGITAANSDPAVFRNPREFDPSRTNKNLAFGHGEHFCLGSHLARQELQTALKVVLERYPDMRLAPERPAHFSGAVLRGTPELWVRPRGEEDQNLATGNFVMKLGVIPLCEKGLTTEPAWARPFVQMLEQEGVESVWMPEHVIMAEDYEPLYDYSEDGRAPVAPNTQMPDPLHWLSFAAAWTTELRLGTGVLIGPQHSAAILAKRLATLDALSGGRLLTGIGIGWQREEYEAGGGAL